MPFSIGEASGQFMFSGNDYWKLLTRAGIGMSQEYTSMVYFGRDPYNNNDEFYRSFRPDMRVWGWTGYFFNKDRATRRVVSAEGRTGPFASDAALQAYLDSEVRTELNSSIVVVKDETAGADGEMRFVCASKHGGNYTLRIILREESPTSLWLDVVATARGE